MLTKREALLSRIMIAAQVAITIIIFHLTKNFFGENLLTPLSRLFILIQIAVIWTVLFSKFNLGIIFRRVGFINLIQGYLVGVSIGTILIYLEIILFPFIEHKFFVAKYLLIFYFLNLISLIGFKFLFYYSMRLLRRYGRNSRNVIILTNTEFSDYIDDFLRAKDWGYHIKNIISPDVELKKRYKRVKIIGDYDTLTKRLMVRGIDDIFFCLPVNNQFYNVERLLSFSNELGISFHILQHEDKIKNIEEPSERLLFNTYQTTPPNYINVKIKAVLGTFFSVLIILVLLPIFLLIATLIKIEDGGPIFFKQERIGLNGRRFMCYKFRSMVVNAESIQESLMNKNESDGPTFKIENDPRITKIGKIIRKLSLDELPQFYNVLRGEMAIVGPRPPLLKEVVQYEIYQLRRLSMKPGITCIWQVKGRNAVSFDEWMKMDLEYIDNWSIWLDIKLVIQTIGVVFKATGR
jgi:exopolysaccharide biosynthesis polyprenyl glycosylphosphotransferase